MGSGLGLNLLEVQTHRMKAKVKPVSNGLEGESGHKERRDASLGGGDPESVPEKLRRYGSRSAAFRDENQSLSRADPVNPERAAGVELLAAKASATGGRLF